MKNLFCLRNIINQNRQWYSQHYNGLNWQWYDEGIPYAILDYYGSVGSLLDFTEDDWAACRENGWSFGEIAELCEDDWESRKLSVQKRLDKEGLRETKNGRSARI